LVRHLSLLGRANIISRRSTSAFRHSASQPGLIAARLNADFALTGSCSLIGNRVDSHIKLYDASEDRIVWEIRRTSPLKNLLEGPASETVLIAAAMMRQIMKTSADRVLADVPGLPNLRSYTLLLGAMALMNRQTRQEFLLARRMLDELIERAPGRSLPHAWLAQWLNLSIQQGWSDDPLSDGKLALSVCQTALDIDPDSSLALAVRGLIMTTVRRETDAARHLFESALRSDPNEPLAWLFHSANRMFAGDGATALAAARRAIFLTPFDPSLYLFHAIEASAAFVMGDYNLALQLSQRAIRSNRQHVSSQRVRTAALWRLGRPEEARKSAATLLLLEPSLTIDAWRRRSPASPAVATLFADALKGAGIPEN